LGIAITPRWATSQARASCAGVAARLLASLRSAALRASALVDRRIGHRHHAVLLQPRHEREARAALAQRVVDLVRRAALAAAHAHQLGHVVDVEVADAPVADLARDAQRLEGVDRRLQGTLPRQCSR
jgi:hypothetical protein